MTVSIVLYEEIEEGVVHIRLNRPEKLNPFSGEMVREFHGAVRRAVEDPEVRAVICSGEGRAFSAGWDLKEGAEEPAEAQAVGGSFAERAGETLWLETVRLLRRPEKLFIAAVHGWAAGQGVELCVASDLIVCTESARFYFAETRVGWTLTSGVARLLPQMVGLARARRLCLLGETIDGQEAYRIGLAVAVVPEGQQIAAALELARRALGGAPLAVAAQKRLLDSASEMPLRAAQDAEVQAAMWLGHTRDVAEAARAFSEKRQPVFRGI